SPTAQHTGHQATPTRRSSDLRSLVSAGWRAQRENDRRKERGIWGGALEENRGPHLTAVLLTDGSQVCIVYRRSTRAIPCAALAFPSLRRFLTLASACWPQGKIPPQPPGPSPKTKRTKRNAARKDSKSS